MAVDLPLTSSEEAARYRRMGLWRDVTFAERVRAAAANDPEKLAIVEASRRFRYGELVGLIDNLAGALLDLGLQPGEVVAVQTPNCAEQPLVHMACNRVGLLYMPVHDSWRETELKHLLNLAKVRALVIRSSHRGFDHAAMIAGLRPDLPSLEHVFTLGEAAGDFRRFDDLLAPTRRTAAELDARRPDPDLPAHIMLSGGTTALSKISRFSCNDLNAMLGFAADGAEFGPNDVAAALAPAGTGATGYVYPMLMPLLYGATSVILERWGDPEEAVELIAANRCTYAVGIPTQLIRMVPPLESRKPQDFAAFRCFFNAGAPLPYDTAAQIEELMGCAVQSAYGATDGGTPTVTAVHDPRDKRLTTVGRVVPGCECELRRPDGSKAAAGETGEVVWRGADKSWGYLGDEEQTRAAFEDRFYKSGDLGEFDADGYLKIVGRLKDMILRGGRNISPRTIEEQLIQHPAVLDVAVAAMPDPVLGERACAFVVLRPGKALSFEEAVDFLVSCKLAVWQLPERLEIMDDLPKGVGGKVTKKDLTAYVAEKLKAEKRVQA